MLDSLEQEEYTLIQNIIELSIKKSVNSLSKLIEEDVSLLELEFEEILNIQQLSSLIVSEQTYYILTSQIVGELSAESFLIINQENAQLFWEIMLKHHPEKTNEMKDALLLEIDNILTASGVIVLSELLNIKIYGDVPNLRLLDQADMQVFIEQELQTFDFSLTYKAKLQSEESQVKLDFIWGFKKDFLELIRLPENIVNLPTKIDEYFRILTY